MTTFPTDPAATASVDACRPITAHIFLRLCTEPILTTPANCLTPWDTQQERIFTEEGVAPTLAGADGGGQTGQGYPIVLGSQQGGAEICENLCPTITSAAGTSGNNQPVLFENHAIDSRYTGPHEVAPTMSARYGTGGNNVPLISQPSVFIADAGDDPPPAESYLETSLTDRIITAATAWAFSPISAIH